MGIKKWEEFLKTMSDWLRQEGFKVNRENMDIIVDLIFESAITVLEDSIVYLESVLDGEMENRYERR